MEEPVKTPPPENQVSAPPAPEHENNAPAKDVSAAVDNSHGPASTDNTLHPAAPKPMAVTPSSATPTPPKPKQGSVSAKPILVIVVSMVLFGALCAVALYAYSQSN